MILRRRGVIVKFLFNGYYSSTLRNDQMRQGSMRKNRTVLQRFLETGNHSRYNAIKH